MERKINPEDKMYPWRKKCWLRYRRALVAIGILGLLTVALIAVTQSSSNEFNKLTHLEYQKKTYEVEIKENVVKSDVNSINREIVKRSVDLETSKNSIETPKSLKQSAQILNDINIDEKDTKLESQHFKHSRQQSSPSEPHRHPDGNVYYFTGYKCVPARKSEKRPERLRSPHRSSGMLTIELLVTISDHHVSFKFLSSADAMLFFLLNHDEQKKHQKSIMFLLYKLNDST